MAVVVHVLSSTDGGSGGCIGGSTGGGGSCGISRASRKLTGIDLMQQFWPCRSRAVKT